MCWNFSNKIAVSALAIMLIGGCASSDDTAEHANSAAMEKPTQPTRRVVYKTVVVTPDATIKGYFHDQFNIIEHEFPRFTVEKRSDREISVLIPANYGFNVGKADLNRTMRNSISDLSDVLNAYPETSISIHGHTDIQGDLQYNLNLSQERADAVKSIMVANRIHPARIQTIAEAYEMPKCSNTTPQGRECNRRVEIVIKDTSLANN